MHGAHAASHRHSSERSHSNARARTSAGNRTHTRTRTRQRGPYFYSGCNSQLFGGEKNPESLQSLSLMASGDGQNCRDRAGSGDVNGDVPFCSNTWERRPRKDVCAEDIETDFTMRQYVYIIIILYCVRFFCRLRCRTAVQEERYLHIVQTSRVRYVCQGDRIGDAV